MTLSPIGVAVVGTGFGKKIHIPGFQAHHRTNVVAVYNRDQQTAEAIAQHHQIPQACSRLEDLVALPDVQAVSITTPPFLHYDMAKTALQAGKHILLEKPTTLSAIEARDLYHLAQSQNLVAGLDFEFRYVPAWQRLKELLDENYVGQIRLVKIDWLASGRANPDRPWNWYARKDQGGGALGALGSHTFDYIAWLFGSVQSISARLSTTIATRPDPVTGERKPVDADDTCCISLELANGVPCQVILSAVTYQGRGHWVEVYGDRGTLVLGSHNQQDYVHGFQLQASQDGNPLETVSIPDRLDFPRTYPDGRLAPFIRVVHQWTEAIDRKTMLPPSIREGAYSQLLMDLTHQSNETGRSLPVPDLEQFLNNR